MSQLPILDISQYRKSIEKYIELSNEFDGKLDGYLKTPIRKVHLDFC